MNCFPNVLKTMNPYEAHKAIINTYILKKPGDTRLLKRDTSKDKRDIDIIKENHKFLWNDETPTSWEEQLAKKYYDKLFKEYCICDLTFYKENKVALRWRTEQEVVTGKGQFHCGNKKCLLSEGLKTWEVNFAYKEFNEKKNALIKLRLCPSCSEKLNYRTKKREIKRLSSKQIKPKQLKSKEPEKANTSENCSVTSEINRVEAEAETSLWSQPQNIPDKTREEEFEEYLEELLF